MILFTSDCHLGHKAILKYRPQFNTIEEHDEAFFTEVGKLKKRDILFVLGDFIFDSDKFEYYLERLSKYSCRIKLVMGNHDSIKIYTQNIANNIEIQLPLFTYKEHWISHCPIHPDEIRGRKGNIHGHTHGNIIMTDVDELAYKDEYTTEKRADKRYYDVGLDNNNFKFITFEDVLRKF